MNCGGNIELTDATADAGLERYTPTFGIAVTDLDNDGRDDLVVANHGHHPCLFLNLGGYFQEVGALMNMVKADHHGITAVDLDNDGDRDLMLACGGADGIGPGCDNQVFENRLVPDGILGFLNITADTIVSCPPWRSRHFLPVSSADGKRIDLLLACLKREECPQLYFSSMGEGKIRFARDESMMTGGIYSTEGLDGFLDYDRDGDADLIMISNMRPVFLECDEDKYVEQSLLPADLRAVYSMGIGDLNNDGFPDLYFGVAAQRTRSDHVSATNKRIHFVVSRNEDDPEDGIAFTAGGNTIAIDFVQHTPGKTIRDPSNIYIGADCRNPRSRETVISARLAEGEPDFLQPGIYIWRETGSSRWHVKWLYEDEDRQDKGKLMADFITNLEKANMESYSAKMTRDRIFINRNGFGFVEMSHPDLSHQRVTRSLLFCDLNNNGFMDIVGIRGGEPGQPNGEPFLMTNCGQLNFEFRHILKVPEDDIFQADQLVYGFFNEDGLPDLFMTNGYGLNPGFTGPYRLFLNTTSESGNFVILDLEGIESNRDALGTVVELIDENNQLMAYRRLGTRFNRSQSSSLIHFGLGDVSGRVRVRIRWPGIGEWDIREVEVNRINAIRQ